MAGLNDYSVPGGHEKVPRDDDGLRTQIQELEEIIRNLKQHAECTLGPTESGRREQVRSERDRAEEGRRSMHEAFDRWKKSNEEYDRRWEESQARWEEIQRDIKRRLDALEGRSREEESEEGKPEGEGTSDG